MKLLFVALSTAIVVAVSVACIPHVEAQFNMTYVNSTNQTLTALKTIIYNQKLALWLQQDNQERTAQLLITQNKLLNMIESDLHDLVANQTASR